MDGPSQYPQSFHNSPASSTGPATFDTASLSFHAAGAAAGGPSASTIFPHSHSHSHSHSHAHTGTSAAVDFSRDGSPANTSGVGTPVGGAPGGSGAKRGSKKGTKRPRPTLSCTECVRRKSKCDRTIPCSTCIKRGSPEKCRVDDEELRPSQPFAQARDLVALRDRVARLEQLIRMIAPEQAKSMLSPGAMQGTTPGSNTGMGDVRGEMIPAVKHPDSDGEEEHEDGGEAEKAAFALESIAVAGRGPTSLEAGEELNLPLTSQARLRESHLRQQEIDFLMSMLPDWHLSRSLVDAFFTKVAWQNHIIHVPTFEAQYNAMRELIDQRRIGEIDPAFLSLYFMVLACGLFFSPNRTDITPSHQAEYTNTWVLGAQRALTLADWSGRPQLMCIQSVVLLPVVLMHAGGIKRLASWIAAALRMAQLLDLHKLDDKPRPGAKMAQNFTPVEREIGKRLYFSLAHGEVNFASRWLGLGNTPNPGSNSIPNLLNVDDTDLLANQPVSKNIDVPTTSSFQVIRARVMTQDFNARLTGSDARVHKYETVLAFDRRTRELLEQLPAYFRYDRSDDPDIKAIVQARPYIAYQRCVILYGLNNRLLRAHRPFMARGYLDPKYAYSTDRCIKAAKIIIAAQRALRDIFDAADRMYNCLLYCFSSAVVLLVDNFHRLAAPTDINDTSELDAQRHEALDVLAMLRREANTSTIAQAGAKVLEGLLNEESNRRTLRGLPPAKEDFTRNTTPENDAQTLREVVGRMASVSNRPTGSASSISPPALSATDSQPSSHPTPNQPFQSVATRPTPLPPLPTAMAFSVNAQPGAASLMGNGLPSNHDPSAGVATQNFFGFGGGELIGGNEGEDLLRSLGFFEVGAGTSMMSGLGGGASGNAGGPAGDGVASGEAGDALYASMLGGNPNMAQDLSWLDGLGEW